MIELVGIFFEIHLAMVVFFPYLFLWFGMVLDFFLLFLLKG